jgi:hypothetical protein
MRYNELCEARRGGSSKNPRIGVTQIIDKFSSIVTDDIDSMYYISYTMVDKLGINPRSGYNTPIGIYSYPVNDEIFSSIDRSGLVKGVPYMGEAPYIFLFRPKSVNNGLILSEYDRLDRDLNILFRFVSGRDDRITGDIFDAIIENAKNSALIKTPGGQLWNITRILANILVVSDSLSRYTGKLLSVGDRIKYKDETGIITDIYYDTNEYEVDFYDGTDGIVNFDDLDLKPFVSTTSISAEEKLEKLSKLNFSIGDMARATNPNASSRFRIVDVDFDKNVVILSRPDGTEFSRSFKIFYKANPEYAPSSGVNESLVLEYKVGSVRAKRNSVMWTYLLHRVLGYDYVDDSTGLGIIHNNEPIQAVFFGRNVISVIDRFVNPSNKKSLIISPIDVFSNTYSPEELERLEPSVIRKALLLLLKNYKEPSSVIPRKFAGHIVTNSNKLKAKLIIKDLQMYNYFKTIDSNLKDMLDNYIINKIKKLDMNTIIDTRNYGIIWDYFERIKDHNWPEGERILLDVVKNSSDGDEAKLIVSTYENNVLGIVWDEGRELLKSYN